MKFLSSFIIIYHPIRLENLKQCLFFLNLNEKHLISQSELILVCQSNDKNDLIETKSFSKYLKLNLNINSYQKPKMTNIGVSESNSDKIILLDSDRILPKNYFYNNILELKEKQVISTWNLHSLTQIYSNFEIINNLYETKSDLKSISNQMFKKNMFAGNTLMHKSDYWSIGGYDESYDGYGFSDSDMSEKTIKYLHPIWKDDKELHLKHDPICVIDNQEIMIIQNKSKSIINACRFMKKWNKQPCRTTMNIFEKAIKNNLISQEALEILNNFLFLNKTYL